MEIQTSVTLRSLENDFADGPKKNFLRETIEVFEAGANRATIVMCWILAVDHLYDYVFTRHLAAFNAKLALVTDRRVKVSEVTNRDHFGDIPESNFIELLRSAGIISNDVRKLLDQKLGTRNSYAHPSTISLDRHKVVDFVTDLVQNVILKYPL